MANSTKPKNREPKILGQRKAITPPSKVEVHEKSVKRNTRGPSVTGLGTDSYIMQQEENKDLGKPPLSLQKTQN